MRNKISTIQQAYIDVGFSMEPHGADGVAGKKTFEAHENVGKCLRGALVWPDIYPPLRRGLTPRDKERLEAAHEDLRKVVERAAQITETPFMVLEVLRTPERQKKLVASGASKTMNSRHITGHAVDLGAKNDEGDICWDWPLYYKIADAMKAAAVELDIPLEWGGDWKNFKDGPHYQLPWDKYPIKKS